MITTRFSPPLARPLGGAVKAAAPQIPAVLSLYDEDEVDLVQKAWSVSWVPFYLDLPKEDADVPMTPSVVDINELIRGAIEFGVPQRSWPTRPKYGVIGDHLNGHETSWPPRILKPQYPNENILVPIAAPRPRIPMKPIHAALEACAVLTNGNLIPQSTTTPDPAVDENIPPSLTTDESNSEKVYEGPVIPAPPKRGKREAFSVLYYDEETTPRARRTGGMAEHAPASPASDSSSDGSAKGWARLRPKAPPALKITPVVDTNKVAMGSNIWKPHVSEAGPSRRGCNAPNASITKTIHLPVVTSPPDAMGDGNRHRQKFLVSDNRSGLLRILNGTQT
ncbi:hypothetical protein H0H87_007722 [Tephrocybe sp. NHM501043]|nr:hypothetical protein H0H87_007722 [Tephrocybe sp. NHM501043]